MSRDVHDDDDDRMPADRDSPWPAWDDARMKLHESLPVPSQLSDASRTRELESATDRDHDCHYPPGPGAGRDERRVRRRPLSAGLAGPRAAAGGPPRPGPPGYGAVAASKPGHPARPVPGEDSS
jgi:hypothetical protein